MSDRHNRTLFVTCRGAEDGRLPSINDRPACQTSELSVPFEWLYQEKNRLLAGTMIDTFSSDYLIWLGLAEIIRRDYLIIIFRMKNMGCSRGNWRDKPGPVTC